MTGDFRRRFDGAKGSGRERDGRQNGARAPGNGQKLKNEARARKAAGAKFRQEREDFRLSPEEKRLQRQKVGRHKRAARAGQLVSAQAHSKVEEENTDGNVGTTALNRGTEIAEAGVRRAGDAIYGRKFKTGKFTRTAGERAGKEAAGETARTGAKAVQKNFMKKEFQCAAIKKSRAEAANAAGSVSKKFVDKAEDLAGKIGEWVTEHLALNPVVLLVLVGILIVALIVGGGASGGNLFFNILGNGTMQSSYTAEDSEIRAVNDRYRQMESDIQKRVSNIRSDNPGYDEYRISESEVGHNSYDLAALLTVLYEDYTEADVGAKLDEIFDQQYGLAIHPVTEKRTRTETRTGYQTVCNEDGTTSQEAYTYDVEAEYDYHILNVTLTNTALDQVIDNFGLSDDQMSRYRLLKETFGNKKYLFEDDIYSNPDADSGGTAGGADTGYEPSGEALTDSQFAAMWQEARKYVGRAYVWGGSSPSTGFDCSGYVCWVINHSGVGQIGRTTAEGLHQWCDTIPAADRQPGDIIFFQGTYDTRGASHVGIYIGDGKMIHCGDPIKVSGVDSGYFKQHFLCYGRIPD